jgi:hypothetical protein
MAPLHVVRQAVVRLGPAGQGLRTTVLRCTKKRCPNQTPEHNCSPLHPKEVSESDARTHGQRYVDVLAIFTGTEQ